MLSPEAVREIAEPIFAKWLGPLGYERATVRAEPDHDGDPSFNVTLTYRRDVLDPDTSAIARAAIKAGYELRLAMQSQGEHRFPYVTHDFSEQSQAA